MPQEPDEPTNRPPRNPRQNMPGARLHANDDFAIRSDPAATSKRSRQIVVATLALGFGAATYYALSHKDKCQPKPDDPKSCQNSTGYRSSSSSSRGVYSGSSGWRSWTSSSIKSIVRGGFGATGAAHMHGFGG